MIHVACLLWRRDDLHRFPALDFLTKTLCHSGDTATFTDTLTENRTYGVDRRIRQMGTWSNHKNDSTSLRRSKLITGNS